MAQTPLVLRHIGGCKLGDRAPQVLTRGAFGSAMDKTGSPVVTLFGMF